MVSVRNVLNAIAVRLMEVWLLLLGFNPAENWETNDTDCGVHRIWTVQGDMPADAVMDSCILIMDLQAFIERQNQLLNTGFQAYDVTVYPNAGGGSILVSICHTM